MAEEQENIEEGSPQADAGDGQEETDRTAEEAVETSAGEGAPASAPAEPTGEAEQKTARKKKRLPRPERRTRAKPRQEAPKKRKPIVRLAKPERERARRQERRGLVVSSAMDKTIVVKVDTVKAHPRYKKVNRRSTKFHAHDEQNAANVGDVVRIVETRPLSKTKNWRLAEIVEAAR